MSFTRANPGGWVQGNVLTPAQINQIDINHSRAVDGNAGGTYAPATPIVVNGGGMEIDTLDVTVLTAQNVEEATFSGPLAMVGSLATTTLRFGTVTTTTGSASLDNTKDIYLHTGNLTANVTFDLSATNCSAGQIMRYRRSSGGSGWVIFFTSVSSSAGSIADSSIDNGAEFVFNGTRWMPVTWTSGFSA